MALTHSNGLFAGLVLSLAVWSVSRSGLVIDFKRYIEDIERVKQVMGRCERLWRAAGIFKDVLTILTPPGGSASPYNLLPSVSREKRERDADSDLTQDIPEFTNPVGTQPLFGSAVAGPPMSGEADSGPSLLGSRTTYPHQILSHGPANEPSVATTWDALIDRSYAMDPDDVGALPVWVSAQADGLPSAMQQAIQTAYRPSPPDDYAADPSWLVGDPSSMSTTWFGDVLLPDHRT